MRAKKNVDGKRNMDGTVWRVNSPPIDVAPFDSRRRHHMWVEFVLVLVPVPRVDAVCGLCFYVCCWFRPCSEGFSPRFSGFPPSTKTNSSKFQFHPKRKDIFETSS